jgi:hypothetical protein
MCVDCGQPADSDRMLYLAEGHHYGVRLLCADCWPFPRIGSVVTSRAIPFGSLAELEAMGGPPPGSEDGLPPDG